MKIAVVSSGHVPSQWAHSINTLKMAQAFYKLGHDVQVLTVERFWERKNREKISDIHNFYDLNKAIGIVYFKDNLLFDLWDLGGFYHILNILTRITSIRYFLDPEKDISQYCRDNGVDICYCRSYRTVYYNIGNEIPSILESHTSDVTHPDLQRVIQQSHSKYLRSLVTISPILKQNFVRAGVPEHKVLVLDDAVDIEAFRSIDKHEARIKLGLPLDKNLVMYCGSLYEGRGIDFILNAASLLKVVMFTIVGGRPKDVLRWEKYATKLQLANVVFTGFVEHIMVPTYLRAADILLMPYTKDVPTYRWMSPLKLFEYMAAGRPIIATDLEVLREKLKHLETGILIKEKNTEELANAIRQILDDKDLADRLSQNAEKESLAYSITRRAEVVLNRSMGLNVPI